MKLHFTLAALLIAVMLPIAAVACSHNETTKEPGFGIYLVDTGELVLSDEYIESYNASTHEIALNEAGIEKWNSYITGTPPTLAQSLFSKEFSVKVNRLEMYRGKFWSIASSIIEDGVTIQEALFKLDSENNTISIGYNCPAEMYEQQTSSFFETQTPQSSFGIYLVDTGELMLSQQDIKSYNVSTNEIELNDEGLKRWRAFFPGIMSLDREQFAVRIDGQEIFQGRFQSPASSYYDPDATTISYFPGADTVQISFNCFDPRDNPYITDFFKKERLLK